MADPHGFLQFRRRETTYRPIADRVRDYRAVELPIVDADAREQAARCMDCGIPYCHAYGCPLHNRIPEFNELVRRGQWQAASENLHATNNFPEFTGRTCPAPCEPACTLALHDAPVAIKSVENAIVEHAWQAGWIVPQPPAQETGRRVAIIGSGPAGLAAAQQLRRAGHTVVVYERDIVVGGLLSAGIPDFKLEKDIVARRLAQLAAEGVEFQTSVDVGVDVSAAYLRRSFDAILIAIGAQVPRDLPVPGRAHAHNVHFALDYLIQQNRRNAGDVIAPEDTIDAYDQVVAVIGGGDTGSDCVGTANRQGARAIYQFNYHDAPPTRQDPLTVWPRWPDVLRTSSSHAEGCERQWNVSTTGFRTASGRVVALQGVQTEWVRTNGTAQMRAIPDTEFELPVDLVLLACGFKHPAQGGLLAQFGVGLDERGRITVGAAAADVDAAWVPGPYRTSVAHVYAAGDCTLGASLVVHAINAGREAAAAIHADLTAHG